MKSNNDSFNSHVEWICRERVFHRYCASLSIFLQASTPCRVKRDNTALSQPWPNCHTLYPGHPMAPWTKAIVPNESSGQQMNWAWNKRHRRDMARLIRKKKTERHFKSFWENWEFLLSSFGSVFVPLLSGPTTNDKFITLFSCTNCFIFPIKQPLCPGVLSVRRSDEMQTDYLVWMAFPEQQKGQHNNR